MDPLLFLRTTDAWERHLMEAVSQAFIQLERRRDLDRANLLARIITGAR